MDIIELGPFLIKITWLITFVSLLFGYFMVKQRVRMLPYTNNKIPDTLGNTVLIAFLVWKCSYVIFHPTVLINNPLALLYFTGGERGAWLAGVVASIYLYVRTKKENIPLFVYSYVLLSALFASSTVYYLIRSIFENVDRNILIFLSLLSLMTLIWLSKIWKEKEVQEALTQTLLWYSLGRVFLSYFKGYSANFLWGFTKEQLLFLCLSLAMIITQLVIEKKNYSLKNFNNDR